MVYGILLQGRNKELSLVQRMMSLLLFDNICDQKVFDRLQPVGVCIGYERSIKIMESLGTKFKRQLIEAVENNKKIRIVGDNINWTVGVHDQRQDNRGHMQHAFGSAVVVQNTNFEHLSNIYPQRDFVITPVQAFLPSTEDHEILMRDYTILAAKVMLHHIPYFRQFRNIVPKFISQPPHPELEQKTKVIPLPVLYKNEQNYKNVVDILEFYEDLVVKICQITNKDETDFFVHIGGDQLTRERFSGAKAMRDHEDHRKDRFENLSPITFEFFHMQMNLRKMAFKILYRENSVADRGTLGHLKNVISRTTVNENINAHYDADKDFFVSVVDMYIIECVLEYFGMPDVNSAPSMHIPPEFNGDEDKKVWFFNEMREMFRREITPEKSAEEEIEVEGEVKTVTTKLLDGQERQLSILKRKLRSKFKEDKVLNYSRRLLELGLLFKDWLDFCKMPNRDRGLCLLRYSMLIFKSSNNLSKYAYEIMRLLVHQTCIMSEKAANEEFYALFVNTTGHFNGHIPADKRMEYLVKEVKEHIKHMFSNKTERNIRNRSSAISSIREISEHFDEITNVVGRSKRHSDKSAVGDEISILNELRDVRPFSYVEGRSNDLFPNIAASSTTGLNVTNYHCWIEEKKLQFSVEHGN